jgi:hypothetical protein
MIANQWIETSRNIYAKFLSLYPKEHRAEYGESMQQVFTDQCRSTYQEKGISGIILLWFRVLPDLGYTALLEHVTLPRASWGLMEPIPNEPLPWKGIFLILLPGLVYLVSQVAQVTGQAWYMTVYYRAAFYLIIPVLIVWAITRRFPIWGLIPFGLLFRLVQEIGYYMVFMQPTVFSHRPLLNAILSATKLFKTELLIPSGLFAIAIVLLAFRYVRQQKPSRSFWISITVCLLVVVAQMVYTYNSMLAYMEQYDVSSAINLFRNSISLDIYEYTGFLLLIFIGTLFTRRHGFFAILIPIGYILPIIVVGMPWNLEGASTSAVASIIIAILAYRSLLSLVTPIWVSRTGSVAGKKRAILISIALALAIHAVMQFYSVWLYQGWTISAEWVSSVALGEIKLISAIILGIVLYQNSMPVINAPDPFPIKYPEITVGKT